MADFPISPTPGTTFTAPDGTVWTWDGYSWTATGGGGGGSLANVVISANSSSSVNANGLNFVNTSTIGVNVNPGGAAGNANVTLTLLGGVQGVQGTTGIQGFTGIQGTQGTQGTQGVQGTTGIQGTQGTQGTQGVQGTTGLQGTQGVQGLDGLYAAQGIQGPQGTQGVQGTAGIIGYDGAQGTTGAQGTQGVQGKTGIQGTQGVQGRQGTTGAQGVQGTQGVQGPGGLTTTDATTLDSLDSTDFTRRYASSNTGMTAGWYTIAVNGGNRAVGRFVLTDDSSGAHQSVVFDATHHYGNGNGITVHHQGAYSTTYFRYLRIMSGLTYDGAMLQVYIDGTTSGTLKVAIDGNEQNQGWTVKGFIIGSSNPGTVFAYANLTSTTANTDLDYGTAGANKILVTGNIYAGSATTQYQVIHKGCTADSLQLGSLGIGTAASGTAGEIRATNNITAYYSDMRLKNKLYNIDNPLWKVMRLSGFYFEPNEIAQAFGYELKREVGVSAQEVEAVMPEAVAPAPISDKYLTVRYEKLVPLLIEAIKELKREVDELKERL